MRISPRGRSAPSLAAPALAAVALAAVVTSGCSSAPSEPVDAQLIVFAVVDPVLEPGSPRPGSVLFLSTVAGQAWIHRATDGTTIVERQRVEGGALQVFQLVGSDLDPGINYLLLALAGDSGLQREHEFSILADAMCTREEHCVPLHCVGYECIE